MLYASELSPLTMIEEAKLQFPFGRNLVSLLTRMSQANRPCHLIIHWFGKSMLSCEPSNWVLLTWIYSLACCVNLASKDWCKQTGYARELQAGKCVFKWMSYFRIWNNCPDPEDNGSLVALLISNSNIVSSEEKQVLYLSICCLCYLGFFKKNNNTFFWWPRYWNIPFKTYSHNRIKSWLNGHRKSH